MPNARLDDWKEAYFPEAREGTFHFALFADEYEDGSAAGMGEAFGDDLVVFMGHIRTAQSLEAVWMQEMGHNILGVRHSLCTSDSTHMADTGHYHHNPRALHFEPSNEEAGFDFYDEGNNALGACTAGDGLQDVFAHSNDPNDAMSFSYNALNFFGSTYSPETWNSFEVWKGALAGSPSFALAGHERHDHRHDFAVKFPVEVVARWDEVNLRVSRSS